MIKLISDLDFCFELDLDQINFSKNIWKNSPKMRKVMKSGGFSSKKKAGQKRRQEREKSETENIQRSTDSGS